MPMQVCSAVQATGRSSASSTGCCSLGRKDARAVYSLQGCACVGRGSAAWIPDSQQMVWYPLRYSLAQHGLLSSQKPKPGPKGVRSVAGFTRAPILPLAFCARHPQMLRRFFVRDGKLGTHCHQCRRRLARACPTHSRTALRMRVF